MNDRRVAHVLIPVLLAALAGCNGAGDPAPRETVTVPGPTVIETVTPDPVEGALPEGWATCTDEGQGYEIGYPEDWQSDAQGLEDECRLFDPEPFEIEPQTELPVTAMMVHRARLSFERAVEEWFDEDLYDIKIEEETTVDGNDAIRYERTQREGLLYPEGTTFYGYLIDHEGRAFYVQTVEIPGEDRNSERFREVVDQAVDSLSFNR